MKFTINLSQEEYLKFYNDQPNASFMQSYAWGEVIEQTRKQIPIYVGLKNDNNEVVAAALLLKRVTPLKMCYYYSPRGFIIDFNDKELLKAFTNGIKQFLKKENAIYLKVDPEIIYHQINQDGSIKEDGTNNYDIFNNIKDAGYTHLGFNRLFEHNQPRFSFRRYLKNYPDVASIDSSMSKTFMKTVRRSYKYDLEVVEGTDPNVFYELARLTADKDGFTTFTKDFYNTFFNKFHKLGLAKIFNIVVYPDKLLEKDRNEITELQTKLENKQLSKKDTNAAPDIIKRLEKNIEVFAPYEGKFPDGNVVCSLMCVYNKIGMWTLYVGNNDLGFHTSAVNRAYYEAIIDSHKMGLEFVDLFGTTGDPKTTYKNLASIHEYKRKFGDEYIEFIGEFDLINKPFWYKMLPKLLKLYRKLK